MSNGRDHTHTMAKQTLRLAFFLSLIIVAAEVGGLLAHLSSITRVEKG